MVAHNTSSCVINTSACRKRDKYVLNPMCYKYTLKGLVNDPLVYTGKTTARLGAELLKAMQCVTDQAPKIRLLIMIVQGSDDKLVDPSGAQLLYDLVSSKDKTIKIYNGFYHEVFNEPEHEQVLNDVKTWIEAHLCVT